MSEFYLGLELMGYGLAGVFIVLILFFIVIKMLIKIFPYKEEQN
jgi:Na+-transporting methylmalonyl-CoA/oxaloacetate decarboxylase gamma subunit